MPIYEYACSKCGHQFEKMLRIGAENPPCPSCESSEVRKLISASGFILKGGGWYKDHYGLKGDSGSSSEGKSAESKSAESKPAESKPSESKPSESKPSGDSAPKPSTTTPASK